MKIGAYQYGVTDDIFKNLEIIKKAVTLSIKKNIKLIVFPECALTGYPPRDIESSANTNLENLERAYEELVNLSSTNDVI